MEQYFNEQYLEQLFNEKLRDSKAKGIDKLNANSFLNTKEGSISIIVKKTLDSSYRFSPYIEILKLKGRNKFPRIISIPTIRDRLTLLVLKEILHDSFPESVNRKLPNSYIREIKDYLSCKNDIYFLKLDIQNFYDSINRELLLDILNEKGLDERIIYLVNEAISTPTIPTHLEKGAYGNYSLAKGVPQGLSISNILAQIYLSSFDIKMGRRAFFYRRYVDDIIILNEGEISKYRINSIRAEIESLFLRLNEDKNEGGDLHAGFNFLSYKVLQKGVSIADRNIQIFIRRIAAKFTWYRNGLIEKNKRPEWLHNDDARYLSLIHI